MTAITQNDMKVLVLCSGNPKNGKFTFEVDNAFISDQVLSLKESGVNMIVNLVKGISVEKKLRLSNLTALESKVVV